MREVLGHYFFSAFPQGHELIHSVCSVCVCACVCALDLDSRGHARSCLSVRLWEEITVCWCCVITALQLKMLESLSSHCLYKFNKHSAN